MRCVYNAVNLQESSLVNGPLRVQFALGNANAQPAKRSVFDFLRAELATVAPGATWVAAGTGHYQCEVNQWCLASGGHCRTGLKKKLEFNADRLAVSNTESAPIAPEGPKIV